MTKREKLIAKALNNPKGLSFQDFQQLLRGASWTFDHQRGSHQIWYSPTGHRLLGIACQFRRPMTARPRAIRSSNSLHGLKVRTIMATNDRFDGFTVNVYQDDEGDYLAHFVELPSVSAFASTPEEALNELSEAWAGVQESYEKRGETVPVAPARREYSGSFNVRIDRRVHRALAIEAAQAGVSLNALIAQRLAKHA